MHRSQQARCWVFTMNNPKHSYEEVAELITTHPHFRYLIFQLEKGDSGTPHFQGYVEFSSPVRFNAMRHLIPHSHVAQRRGTRAQCKDYSSKEEGRLDGPYEYGDFASGGQGHRSDLTELVESMRQATSFKEVVVTHPELNIRYARGIQSTWHYLHVPPVRPPPRILLIYGPTGSGKTRYAHTLEDVFSKSGDDGWFDAYTGQKTLLIDDFAGARSKVSLSFLLQVLDRYNLLLPIKGNFVQLLATTIVITSNIHPRQWYEYGGREEHYRALKRRISEVYFFTLTSSQQIDKEQFFTAWSEGCDEDTVFIPILTLSLPWDDDSFESLDSTLGSSYE